MLLKALDLALSRTFLNSLAFCQTCNSCRTGFNGTQATRNFSWTVGPRLQNVSYLSDPENTGKLTDGVNFDTLGSWNNRIDLGINMSESIRRGRLIPNVSLEKVAMATMLGRRTENEDRVLVREVRPNLLLFAIFDGHGGSTAVDYCHVHMLDHINYWLGRGETNLHTVLRKSFIDINNAFTRYIYHHFKGSENAMYCGTTATVCLLRNGTELVVAHVGDSRATLCRDGKHLRLTVDHMPDDPKEKDRIEKNSGRLTWSSLGRPRVNGRLEMTRSIGDVELKAFGVTAEPDVKSIEIRHGSDAFLALTSDGIHNVLNSGEIVKVISGCADPKDASKFLTDQALLFGSEDNCTVLIVPFGAWGKFANISRQVHFTLSRNLSHRNYV